MQNQSPILALVGTDESDVLEGTLDGLNVIYALGGSDLIRITREQGYAVIHAGTGNDDVTTNNNNDIVYAGEGDDTVKLAAGNDVSYAGDGDDVLSGGAGNDFLDGESGRDTAVFSGNSADYDLTFADDNIIVTSMAEENGDGSDTLANVELLQFADGVQEVEQATNLTGTNGDDVLEGTSVDLNLIRGRGGDDTITVTNELGFGEIYGAAGNDAITGGLRYGDQIYGEGGNDTLVGRGGDDNLQGGNGSDYIQGDAGNDRLYGNKSNDTLLGGSGDDSLTGGPGDDELDGGEGTDRAVFDGDLADYDVSFVGNQVVVAAVAAGNDNGTDTLTNVELLQFKDGVHAVVDLAPPSNTEPVAVDDSATTSAEAPVVLDVLANDSDPDGDALTIVEVGTPSHGEAVVNGNGTLTYTPDAGFAGEDSFDYTAEDGRGGTADANVSVMVEAQPLEGLVGTEGDDVLEGVLEGINIIHGLGGNDTITVTNSQSSGELYGGEGDDRITGSTYGDDVAYGGAGNDRFDGRWGSDTFYGGEGDDFATGGRGAGGDWLFGGAGNDTLDGGNSGDNGDDWLDGGADDDILNGGSGDDVLDGGEGTDRAVFAGDLADYDVSFVGNQVVVAAVATGNNDGTDTLTNVELLQFKDGVRAVVDLAPPSNTEPVALDDSATTSAEAPVVLDVLANDSDPDGDALTIVEVGTPSHGEAVVNGNGTLTYTPDAGFAGEDSFDYTAEDGRGGTADANVSVMVEAQPLEGLVGTEGDDVLEGVLEGINIIHGLGGNDTITVTNSQSSGELYGGEGDDRITGSTYGDDVAYGGAGNDRFDGRWGSDTFYGGEGDDFATGGRGAGGDWLFGGAGNDTLDGGNSGDNGDDWLDGGADDDILNGGSGDDVLDGGEGTDRAVFAGDLADYDVSFVGNQVVVAAVATGNNDGTDTLTNVELLQFKDGVRAVVDLAPPSNTEPVALDDSATTSAEAPVVLDVLANDSDPDGDALTIVEVGTPSHGEAVVNGNGTLTYTPDAGFAGEDSFDYTAEDGRGGTADANVSVMVEAQPLEGLVGTEGDDVLEGVLEGINIIHGLGGNDTITVTNSQSSGELYGGEGDDRITRVDLWRRCCIWRSRQRQV